MGYLVQTVLAEEPQACLKIASFEHFGRLDQRTRACNLNSPGWPGESYPRKPDRHRSGSRHHQVQEFGVS